MIDCSIEQYHEGLRTEWNQYVFDHALGTFFHRIEWRDVLHGMGFETYYLIARAAGNICGVMPIAHVRSLLFGNHLISLPFCASAGPIADDEPVVHALSEAAIQLAKELQVGDLEIRGLGSPSVEWQTKSLYYSFRRGIAESEESNLKAIPRKQRAIVRKGVNSGLQADVGRDLDTFYKIYAESVRNLGTPVFSRALFRYLLDAFPNDSDILTVRDPSGKPVAAVLGFYFKDEVLPYYGGSLSVARQLKANDFMYWSLMCHAAKRGFETFDFGRSKFGTGPFKFKKNWGFEPVQLPYQYYLHNAKGIPQVNPNNPKYRYLISIWKQFPLPVANALGPLFSKYLG
jgi:FemAB-related protein (PEP-CTERM system-associated)